RKGRPISDQRDVRSGRGGDLGGGLAGDPTDRLFGMAGERSPIDGSDPDARVEAVVPVVGVVRGWRKVLGQDLRESMVEAGGPLPHLLLRIAEQVLVDP